MSEENKEETKKQDVSGDEMTVKVAEFQQELVGLLTSAELPVPVLIQLLLSTAATITIHQGLSRAQFMEAARTFFTQVQALNKQGLVKDQASPPAGPSIIMPGK